MHVAAAVQAQELSGARARAVVVVDVLPRIPRCICSAACDIHTTVTLALIAAGWCVPPPEEEAQDEAE